MIKTLYSLKQLLPLGGGGHFENTLVGVPRHIQRGVLRSGTTPRGGGVLGTDTSCNQWVLGTGTTRKKHCLEYKERYITEFWHRQFEYIRRALPCYEVACITKHDQSKLILEH